MTMNKGERGPLYDYLEGGAYQGGSGSRKPEQNQLVPATQADLEALSEQYEGRIENWRERFPEGRIEHYRDGGSGGIFKGYDAERGRVVGIKELKGSKEGVDLEFLQTGEDQIGNIKDMIGALGNSSHPGLMKIYGYYETERRGLKYPQLVFELIDQPSLLDKINGSASEEEVKRFLLAGGSTLYDLHTGNGQPIFHRDVKPANFMGMPEDSRWPYVLVDFGSVGIGVRETMKGTQPGTLRYVPHKQLAMGKVNKGTENFALIRSAIHYALGKRFEEIDLDGFDIRGLDLNYSDELLDVFATTTTQEESTWYRDFGKLMHDIGYERAEIPRTRAELEAILGHRSLPAQTQEPKPSREVVEGDVQKNDFPYKRFSISLRDSPVKKVNVGVNVGGLGSIVKGNAAVSVCGRDSWIEGNVGVGVGGVASFTDGHAGLSVSGLFSGAGGNAGVSVGGVASFTKGNAGVSVGGLLSFVKKNAGVSVGGFYSETGSSRYLTLENLAGRFGKYVPSFLKGISVPAFNIGAVTNTGDTDNAVIFGAYNNIEETNGDYLAFGLLNRVKTKEGKRIFVPLVAGRITLDGILRHESEQQKRSKDLESMAQDGDVGLTRAEAIGARDRSFYFAAAGILAAGAGGIFLESLPLISIMIPLYMTYFANSERLKNRKLKQKRIAAGLEGDVGDKLTEGGNEE